MAPPDAYARRRDAARPPREGRRGQRSPSRLAQESRNARTREKLQHSRSSSALADEESPPPPKNSPRRSPRIDVSK